ncbi:glycosyltransferase family 4 protein [Rubrobacter xylanophilus]|uniref:glycosyltransferase family 4 protein n=1 Tax=Rubrobacter xylanophilus TaxID=49319 RepID=UPI001E2C5D32|nr:glycosyltransferase family 4 protein [Rubrobacter xylanophilus]
MLMISGSLPPRVCGVGDNAFRLAAALSEAGMNVEILTTTGPVPDDSLGVDIHASVRNWNLLRLSEAMREIRAIRPDIVHLQYPTAEYKAGLLPQALVLSRVPLVVTIHEASYVHILRRISLYPFLILADRVVATTRFEADFLVGLYPSVRKKLSVVSIGSSIPAGPVLVRDRNTIMYFGLIAPRKGIEEFLELADLAGEAGKPWTFRIVGALSSRWREYAQELHKDALSLSVEWHLNLSAEEVAKHLASVGAVYLPFPDGASLRRSSLIAALVNSSPIITTRGGSTPSDLVDGENVLFANSPEVALKKIQRLVSDAELSRRLSCGAAEYGKRFSWSQIAEQYIDLYGYVLSTRKRGRP